MLLATLVNLLLLIVFFIIGFVLINLFMNAYPDSQIAPLLIGLVFIVSIAGSFLVYSRMVKWANNKFNLEEKMDPLFSSKKNRRDKRD